MLRSSEGHQAALGTRLCYPAGLRPQPSPAHPGDAGLKQTSVMVLGDQILPGSQGLLQGESEVGPG